MPEKDTTSTEGCGLCGETLQVGPRIADQTVGPCPRCLSVLVDDALRAFAREWLGFNVWAYTGHAQPWYGSQSQGMARYVLPLYLPAGMDLGVRWLAHRLDGAGRGQWGRLLDRAHLWSLYGGHTGARDGFVFGPTVVGAPDIVVPALATIPADAPPRLRAARALALCLEVTS